METKLYFDCTTGISGDMITAALLDLGADQEVLERAISSIEAGGFSTRISRVLKSGVDACDFAVLLDKEHENHDHDMEWLFGTEEQKHTHPHSHDHDHEAGHTHSHDHDHEAEHAHSHHHDHEDGHNHNHHHDHEAGHDHGHHHDHEVGHDHGHHHDHGDGHTHGHHHAHGHTHSHTHEHRHLPDILSILASCDMTDGARRIAEKTFRILAEAEAKAHHATPETVGFHEAGAIDSIVDIVAASVCLDNLAPSKVYIPVLYEGRGTIRCQHGILPVPVPAVVNIVEAHGIPLHIADYRGEYVTPTGAAFAAAVATDWTLPEQFRIQKTGVGAGKRSYAVPGMLRVFRIEEKTEQESEGKIVRLETNIDDSTGEVFGYVLEKLLEAGARDVHYFPVFMKKNRPAYQLNVICMPSDAERLKNLIFRETSTIGIRSVEMDRTVLERKIVTLETSIGRADVKIAGIGEEMRCYPEYRTAAEAASQHQIPLREAMLIIEREAMEQLKADR